MSMDLPIMTNQCSCQPITIIISYQSLIIVTLDDSLFITAFQHANEFMMSFGLKGEFTCKKKATQLKTTPTFNASQLYVYSNIFVQGLDTWIVENIRLDAKWV